MKFPKSRQSYHIQFSPTPVLFYFVPLKSIFYRSENIWTRHSCINNPLKSLEGFEILTKELAGMSYCRSSYGSRGKMCLSPIMNHTKQQQHGTSRPGLSPRQPDSKSLSLQMALRENRWKTVWERFVCNAVLSIKSIVIRKCSQHYHAFTCLFMCERTQRQSWSLIR